MELGGDPACTGSARFIREDNVKTHCSVGTEREIGKKGPDQVLSDPCV